MLLEIAPQFGYVVLVCIASFFVTMWLGINVGRARKKYEVKYPDMYSDKHVAFNCIQRAHQNMLEGYPAYLMLQVFSGLYAPTASAIGGAVFLCGRIAYARGYYTGDPAKRTQGAFGYLGLLILLANSFTFALHIIGIYF